MGRDLKAQRQSQEGKGTKAIGWAQQLTSGQVPSKTTIVRPQARAASGPPGASALESSDSGRGLARRWRGNFLR